MDKRKGAMHYGKQDLCLRLVFQNICLASRTCNIVPVFFTEANKI